MSPPDEFRALYEAHFDFVWRSLRRLGVRDVTRFGIPGVCTGALAGLAA